MRCLLASFVLVVLCANGLQADYVIERKAAIALMQSRQYAQAIDALTVMAETAGSDLQKADALTLAATCAAHLGDQDRAVKIAESIPLAPESKAAQMHIMHIARQWSAMLEQFGNEDLSQWPDYVANDAYFTRGQAAIFSKNYQQAVDDLEAAVRFPMRLQQRGTTLNLLGAAYSNLGNDDRALEVYGQSQKVADNYRAAGASMAISRIYTSRGEHDKAAAALQTINTDDMKSIVWICMTWEARGDVKAGAGDTPGAIQAYKQALAIKGIPAHIKANCEEKIEALSPQEK